MNNSINRSPYLRTSRGMPEELHQLSIEINKAYVDIASAVNARTIGIFPINRPAITGESWYVNNSLRQQSLRQVYMFTSTTDIPIGFKISSISQFSRFSGIYTDGTSWYGLNGGTSVAIAGQITSYVVVNGSSTTSDTLRFSVGAGAPALTSGTVVLEWLSNN